jgi:EXS family protein
MAHSASVGGFAFLIVSRVINTVWHNLDHYQYPHVVRCVGSCFDTYGPPRHVSAVGCLLVSLHAQGYSFWWDCRMDWGLLEDWRGGEILRSERLYPFRAQYYASMALNLSLRLAWVLPLIPHTKAALTPLGMATLAELLEVPM